jgi:hypothetical protein
MKHFAAFVVLAAITGWVHLYQFTALPQWDTWAFLLSARWLHQGIIPYRDAWDVRPPGSTLYMAGVFSLLPTTIWSVRLVDVAIYLIGAFLLYALAQELIVWPLAVIAAGIWTVLIHDPMWDIGGLWPEQLLSVCWIGAWLAAMRGLPMLAGVAIGTSALFKHAGAFMLLPVALLCCTRCRDIFKIAAGAAIPYAAVTLYFWAEGGLTDFLAALLAARRCVIQADLRQRLFVYWWGSIVHQVNWHPILLWLAATGALAGC